MPQVCWKHTYTVETPIKRLSYFNFLENLSLSCEMFLSYKKFKFETFCDNFLLLQPIYTKLLFISAFKDKIINFYFWTQELTKFGTKIDKNLLLHSLFLWHN